MDRFTIKPACRLETEAPVWDVDLQTWRTARLKNPRLVQNPPQQFTSEQKQSLKEYMALLAELIRLETQAHYSGPDGL
jgi:hypothetical protein